MILETKRLRIRKHTISDLEEYQEMQANPKVMGMVPSPVMKLKESEAFLHEIIKDYEDPKSDKDIFAVDLKLTGEFIGNCAIIYLRENREVGYRLKERFWNNGYATEITEALICFIFSSTNETKIIADCDVLNIGSTKVLQKFMHRIGESYNEKDKCNDYHFELTKEDWMKNTQPS